MPGLQDHPASHDGERLTTDWVAYVGAEPRPVQLLLRPTAERRRGFLVVGLRQKYDGLQLREG